ncbi:MarR family transcriptional regulator [Phytomonospora sp. NPDC050363]|uniref:MarR family winged helix-turn-helix transcriptional regulator n=1 Tax=Phytomonospora sp. NPDC050363 TaxID=3155642 RepID=UPI0034026AC8
MRMPAGERLGLDIKRAEQELMAAKSTAVRAAGLTVPQYAALFTLDGNPGMSAAALARACLVTPQAMTVVLRNLEEHGLVERTPHEWHRHIKEARLTDEGRAALAAADERAVKIERAIAAALSPQERETLRDLLKRASTAVGEAAAAL